MHKKHRKRHHQGYSPTAGILALALLGFFAGLFYSSTSITGFAVDAPTAVDLAIADAFFIKESEFKAIVGTRQLRDVAPDELSPFRVKDMWLKESVYLVAVVRNKGTQSIGEALTQASSAYTPCNIAGSIAMIRNGVSFNRQGYLTWDCADLAPGESRAIVGDFVHELNSDGGYCLDIVVDMYDTVSESEEGNNARHNIGCMTVFPVAQRK